VEGSPESPHSPGLSGRYFLNVSDQGKYHMSSNDDFADLLQGAQAIADYIGKTYRQTVYLLSAKRLPAWKIGQEWYSTKPKIRARLMGEDGGA
jgi:hypothetical protein